MTVLDDTFFNVDTHQLGIFNSIEFKLFRFKIFTGFSTHVHIVYFQRFDMRNGVPASKEVYSGINATFLRSFFMRVHVELERLHISV